MDEAKERFFEAVMFAVGPPPVDATRLGTAVGSKVAPLPMRNTQYRVFVPAMVRLADQLGVSLGLWGGMYLEMYVDYAKWYLQQEDERRMNEVLDNASTWL